MKILSKTLIYCCTFLTMTLSYGMSQAQPVFDLPETDVTMPGFVGDDVVSLPTTLQVGEMETGIINPITGEPLNDVVFVFNPIDTGIVAAEQTIRFFTLYHTSEVDTRALQLSTPGDLVYPPAQDHIFFEASLSVQILDLDRDGQNDLAFNGYIVSDCNPVECGPAPVLGALGTGADPFVTGNVDMIGRTLQRYNFPIFISLPTTSPFIFIYGGQPSLAPGDMNGNGFTDLVINDWRIPGLGASDEVGGAGPVNGGQFLSTFLNNGTLGSLLPPVETPINFLLPIFDEDEAVPLYIVVDDFDMNGVNDAAVLYSLEEADDEFAFRVMVYPGNGDGTFNPNPTVSEDIAQVGLFEAAPNAFTYGDFDGNGHLDFAAIFSPVTQNFLLSNSTTAVVTCAPGTPPTCSVQSLTSADPKIAVSIDAGDFDGDGLDDLVQLEIVCTETAPLPQGPVQCVAIQGQASAYLNQGGSFVTTADQTIIPSVPMDEFFLPVQVIAKDIDGCSPEDVAFTGWETSGFLFNNSGQGGPMGTGRGIVAFASQGGVTADAGIPVSVNGGFQVGGNPTCSDSNGNPFTIEWTQLSGNPANISDPTAANPIISGVSDQSVFQVTCTTACGVDSDTVTINQAICITGSGHFWDTIRAGCAGCSLNRSASGQVPVALGLMGLGLLVAMSGLRLRRRRHR